MIAQTPLPHKSTVRVVPVTLPRPTGPVDVAAHLAQLGTSLAPGPRLDLRPARDRHRGRRLAWSLALAVLAGLVVVASATAGTLDPTPGHVSHINVRSGSFLGAVVMEAGSTREARALDEALDERTLEDQFDVTILEEIVFTRAEARGIGVDSFRSSFFTQGFATSGMINIARDGATVFLLIYVATEEPDFDAAFAYQGRLFEDGIDARAPWGFEEYDREATDELPAFETKSL